MLQVNLNALQDLTTKKSSKIILKKEDYDYTYSVGKFYFIATKQPKSGYYLECYKWCDRNLFQTNVDTGIYDIISLKEVKQVIFLFLLNQAVENAAKKVLNN